MRFLTLLCLSFLLFSVSAFAQNNYAVKGSVADSVEHVKLGNSAIVVMEAKDSIMVRFTRAAADGSFSLSGLGKGKFILLVSYPDYADYSESFSLDSANQTHNFGNIHMSPKSRLLKEVIIKGTAAQMKIKGDTTEFNARAFVTQPNAKVEDLLKQLPGISVDKDGKITAQGETVGKVLVDGEEFFGDDPTLVTKNIRADMVDKVQIYDKKSDQATFTGIDDGQRTKTINIKLREDKKDGYFGKADGGYGTDDYYEGQLLFNRFKNKLKFSVYGTIGNDGKTGLGWEDSQKYTGGSDNVQIIDGGFMITSGGDDLDSFSGNYNGRGTPIARTGGAHFDDKFNNDKESVNINYKVGELTVNGTDNTQSQNNFVRDSSIFSNSNQTYHNYAFRQKLDVTYSIKLDTTSDLKLHVDGTLRHSMTTSSYTQTEMLNDSLLLNKSTRNLTNTVDSRGFDASAFYTKKFKKKGRTFSWNISEGYNLSQAHGYLVDTVTYYAYNPTTTHDSILNQYKTNRLVSSTLNSNMTYTEPLSKTLTLVANYGFGLGNSTADRQSFDALSPGVYSMLPDTTYSNDFRLRELSNQEGAVLNFKKDKVTFNFGTKVTEVQFDQTDVVHDDETKRNFINWAPQAFFQYTISKQSGINFNYSGRTTQPTLDQLQPLRSNNDQLNIVEGNPNLTPSFTNNLRLNYHSYKVLTDVSIFSYASFSFTSNPIVNNTITEPPSTTTGDPGKTITQYVNLAREPYNYYGGLYYGRKIQGPDIQVGIDGNVNGSENYNLSNNLVDDIYSNTYGFSLRVSKYVEKKYDFNVSFGPTYTLSGSSLQTTTNNNGHGYQGYFGGTVFLPGKFQVSSDGNYQYNSPTPTFPTSYSKLLWNASLVKSFTKQENLKLMLTCNDILNQNSGFDRNINGNLITQDHYTTLKRFFMISVVWDFNHMGGGAPKAQ